MGTFRDLLVYQKAFTETQGWLDFSLACKYITEEVYKDKITKSEEIGRLLNSMIQYPEKYGSK